MDSSIPNANTSRNLDADGNPLYPSTYEFKEFIMINKYGQKENITHLVTSLTIAEEIFSPILTARITIRDNENFFEDFGLDGQEIVKVKIEYLDSFEGSEQNKKITYKNLTYQFVVRDYLIFEKTTESINVQEYEINLVSPWAYLSRLQQISKSIKGDPVNAIQGIFNEYLPGPSFNYQNPCYVNNLKAVITKRTPLQAVEYLRGLCYDAESSQFFIYTTLQNTPPQNGEIIARSWADIIGSGNKVYGSYQLKPFVEEGMGTVKNLRELRSKIISLNSNIKLDKLSQAVAGGVGSVIETFSFEDRLYSEKKEKPKTIPVQGSLGTAKGDFNFEYLQSLDLNQRGREVIKDIVDDPTTSRNLRYIPDDPYAVYTKDFETGKSILPKVLGYDSPARTKAIHLAYAKKYFANMESAVHEIGVYGDPNLSAAKKIKIEIPKAVDTNKRVTGIDNSLSGVYIISTSVHIFENGIYSNKLRIIRDGGMLLETTPYTNPFDAYDPTNT